MNANRLVWELVRSRGGTQSLMSKNRSVMWKTLKWETHFCRYRYISFKRANKTRGIRPFIMISANQSINWRQDRHQMTWQDISSCFCNEWGTCVFGLNAVARNVDILRCFSSIYANRNIGSDEWWVAARASIQFRQNHTQLIKFTRRSSSITYLLKWSGFRLKNEERSRSFFFVKGNFGFLNYWFHSTSTRTTIHQLRIRMMTKIKTFSCVFENFSIIILGANDSDIKRKLMKTYSWELN